MTEVVFLLIWYDAGVFVCENTLQCHSLNLMVLVAEQLKTEAEIHCYRYCIFYLFQKLKSTQTFHRTGFIQQVYLVVELSETTLQVERSRVGEFGKNLQMCNQLPTGGERHPINKKNLTQPATTVRKSTTLLHNTGTDTLVDLTI